MAFLAALLLALTLPFAAHSRIEQPQQGLGAWTPYTPTLSCGAGTLTSATATGRYKQVGKTVYVQIAVAITTNGTCASSLIATLPVNSVSGFIYVLTGRNNTSGNIQAGAINGTTAPGQVTIRTVTTLAYPGGDGIAISVNGTYEAN